MQISLYFEYRYCRASTGSRSPITAARVLALPPRSTARALPPVLGLRWERQDDPLLV